MFNAGFTIIAEATTNVYAKQGIVLGHKRTSLGDEWVTWAFTDGYGCEERSYYWGHYFRTEDHAYKDYYARIRHDVEWQISAIEEDERPVVIRG